METKYQQKDLIESSDIFRALGDETRLKILHEIQHKEKCVHEIAENLEIEISNISHHLKKLKDKNIVSKRKEGRHRYYKLTDNHINKILKAGIEHAKE